MSNTFEGSAVDKELFASVLKKLETGDETWERQIFGNAITQAQNVQTLDCVVLNGAGAPYTNPAEAKVALSKAAKGEGTVYISPGPNEPVYKFNKTLLGKVEWKDLAEDTAHLDQSKEQMTEDLRETRAKLEEGPPRRPSRTARFFSGLLRAVTLGLFGGFKSVTEYDQKKAAYTENEFKANQLELNLKFLDQRAAAIEKHHQKANEIHSDNLLRYENRRQIHQEQEKEREREQERADRDRKRRMELTNRIKEQNHLNDDQKNQVHVSDPKMAKRRSRILEMIRIKREKRLSNASAEPEAPKEVNIEKPEEVNIEKLKEKVQERQDRAKEIRNSLVQKKMEEELQENQKKQIVEEQEAPEIQQQRQMLLNRTNSLRGNGLNLMGFPIAKNDTVMINYNNSRIDRFCEVAQFLPSNLLHPLNDMSDNQLCEVIPILAKNSSKFDTMEKAFGKNPSKESVFAGLTGKKPEKVSENQPQDEIKLNLI